MTNRMGVPFAFAGAVLFVVSLGYGIWRYVTDFAGGPESGSLIAAVVTNTALFTVFALHHSLFARTGLKGWVMRHFTPALERSVYVWIASALFIVVCALWRPISTSVWVVPPPWSAALVAVQLAGVFITGVSSRRLDVFALAGLRQARGETPAGDATLITTGWYRVVRHPIYFGWVLMVWPTPHMTGTRLIFALLSTAYLALAIPLEERALIEQFGDRYRQYSTQVRARMVPFLY